MDYRCWKPPKLDIPVTVFLRGGGHAAWAPQPASPTHPANPMEREEATMDFSELNDRFKIYIRDFLEKTTTNPDAFHTLVSPKDEMFNKGILPGYDNDKNVSYFRYLESGKRMFDVYRQIVDFQFGGFDGLTSVMDFASGYGRLTRFLVQNLLPAKIWVSDIYADAVSWQNEYFGVHGIESTGDPKEFVNESRYSIVFVGSLFSHLPDSLFQAWLHKLYESVEEGGILVFSVHDESILPDGCTMSPNGILFQPWSESDTLDTDIYGMTWVTEAYVSRSIKNLCSEHAVPLRRYRKTLYENQDLYVVGRGSSVDLSGLGLVVTPLGGFEYCIPRHDHSVEICGWGIELTPSAQIREIELYVNGVLDQKTIPTADRADILSYFPKAVNMPVRWSFVLPRGRISTDDIVAARLLSASGADCWYYASLPEHFTSAGLKGLTT